MDRIKFYYMEHSNCKETDQTTTTWDHGAKLTRFDKQIDNMHVSIQSRTPPKPTYPKTTNYKIEIEQNYINDIDVRVTMDSRAINLNAPSNFSRSHVRPQNMTENMNTGKESRQQNQINYASENQNKRKHNFYHQHDGDTKYTISIIDYPTNHGYQQQNLATENIMHYDYTNSPLTQNGRIRVLEEKQFGSVAKNGKIVKANVQSRTSLLEDYAINFTINESIHSKSKFEGVNTTVKQMEESQLRDSHNIDSSKLEQERPQAPNINHKKDKEIQQKDQIIQTQQSQGEEFKSIRKQDKKADEKGTSVQTPKGEQNKKLLLTPQTGIRNKNSHSPSVYDYAKEDVIPSDDETFLLTQVQKPTKVTKPKLQLKTGQSHPPSPTIEKSIQKYFNNLNYSMNSSKKHLDKSFNRPIRDESPLSVGPISRQKQSKQKGKDKINVSQNVEIDTFTVNKNRYLDKLRRQQKSRSRMSQSRTFSRRQHSLSPECQAITDRLYNTKINKQPCPKFVKYHDAMQRSRVKDTLKNYTFISKYLSDHEIYDIMAELQENNVPEKKWALKLVDIVYDKLRVIRAY